MAKFVFELDAVLEQRRAAERAKQLAVAALERDRLGLEECIKVVQREIAREKEDLREHLSGVARTSGPGYMVARTSEPGNMVARTSEPGNMVARTSGPGAPPPGPEVRATDMRAVRLQAGASLRLLGRAHHGALQLAGVLARLANARRDLMEATTRRKAVETLRERRWHAWKTTLDRREAAALDELNVMSASRKES